MRAIPETLHERVNCGVATFLTKLRAHSRSGEPLNELSDSRAKVGRDSEAEARMWTQPWDRGTWKVANKYYYPVAQTGT